MNSQEEISKTYSYERNGKKQTVKRVYKITGEKKTKRSELKYFFEHGYNNDLHMRENHKIFNTTATYPISYSMFFTNFKTHQKQI